MPLPTLDVLVPPSLPLSIKEIPRVRGLTFGQGYMQRATDGLNWLDGEAIVSWDPITKTEADVLINFFRQMKGSSAFTYTLDDTTWTYIATEWNRSKKSASHYAVEATLKRVFDV